MGDQNKEYTRQRPRGPKYHQCPFCYKQGILIVDVDNETLAETDNAGNMQYFCPKCNKTFSVVISGKVLCR